MNAPFGKDSTLEELVERIRGFDTQDTSSAEMLRLVGVMKLLAEEITQRWANLRKAEASLLARSNEQDLTDELRAVCVILKGKRETGFFPQRPSRSWWRKWLYE